MRKKAPASDDSLLAMSGIPMLCELRLSPKDNQ